MIATPSTWRHGDIVRRGESVGVVHQMKRQSDGRPYLKVRIVSGPLATTKGWDWPEGWTPCLDVGDNPTYPATCSNCGRDFKAAKSFEAFCRTCDEAGYRQPGGGR